MAEQTSTSNVCVVEFQAFRGNEDEYIVKELAIAVARGNNISPKVLLFKPPYVRNTLCKKSLKMSYWLENNYHGISWEDGHVDFEQMQSVIEDMCEPFHSVYTKGLEKVKFLETFHGNVVDLDIIRAPKYESSSFTNSFTCPVTKHNITANSVYRGSIVTSDLYTCALKRACYYARWLRTSYLCYFEKRNNEEW